MRGSGAPARLGRSPSLAVVRVADLAHALAGQLHRPDDVNLGQAFIVSTPDRVNEGVVRGSLAGLVLPVPAGQGAESLAVHDLTIGYAYPLDNVQAGRPRWLT